MIMFSTLPPPPRSSLPPYPPNFRPSLQKINKQKTNKNSRNTDTDTHTIRNQNIQAKDQKNKQNIPKQSNREIPLSSLRISICCWTWSPPWNMLDVISDTPLGKTWLFLCQWVSITDGILTRGWSLCPLPLSELESCLTCTCAGTMRGDTDSVSSYMG